MWDVIETKGVRVRMRVNIETKIKIKTETRTRTELNMNINMKKKMKTDVRAKMSMKTNLEPSVFPILHTNSPENTENQCYRVTVCERNRTCPNARPRRPSIDIFSHPSARKSLVSILRHTLK